MMSRGRDEDKPETSAFKLTTDSVFGSRADDIFSNLGHIEAKHNAYQKARSRSRDGRDDDNLIKPDPVDDSEASSSHKRCHGSMISSYQDSSDKCHSSDSSSPRSAADSNDTAFKKPRNPPVSRSRPDNHKRGTYYNLSDVPVMSERSNSTAAFTFLKSLEKGSQQGHHTAHMPNDLETTHPAKKLKTAHQQDDMETGSQGKNIDTVQQADMDVDSDEGCLNKIVFRKPDSKHTADTGEDSALIQIAGRPGCVVMSKYEVGQKPSSKKTRTTMRQSSAEHPKTAVTISHIMDEEDDELSLKPKATRTVFSDCMEGDDDVSKDDKHASDSIKNVKSSKKRTIRSHRNSESDDENEPMSSPVAHDSSFTVDADLDGVD